MPLELFSCALVAKGAFRAGATGSSAPPINQYKEQETKKEEGNQHLLTHVLASESASLKTT